MPANTPPGHDQRNIKQFSREKSSLIMEYAKFGSLKSWLIHQRKMRVKPLPDATLWRLFHCLTKACIAMEYPPRFLDQAHLEQALINQGLNSGPAPLYGYAEVGAMLPEVIPEHHNDRGRLRYVHFDVDPSNILVCNFDDAEHKDVPMFKVFNRSFPFLQ